MESVVSVVMKYKTRGNTSPQGKPRVYFCCHWDDFEKYFEPVSDEILSKQNCAIWYCDAMTERNEEFQEELKRMQLFVLPVTANLLCSENDALHVDFRIAVDHHIPVLPLMQESGLEELFNQKCGELQFLDKNCSDETAVSYNEKLEKYLSSVLIGDALAERIRAAFDAYVFLSYRKKDRKYAQELMRLIHQNDFCRNFAIWYDEFLTPGENFNDSIREAIRKSNLFVLAVTPNLINETNYILTEEYPMAQREKKRILPVELVPTEREQLSQLYSGLPTPANAYHSAELSEALLASIDALAISRRAHSPEHDFFIGLAYLGGVDLEVNLERALELIKGAADAQLPEAMAKLVSMYTNGAGVERDKDEALQWSQKLGVLYFDQCFTFDGRLHSSEKLQELFDHYSDPSWEDAIRCFLLAVDERLSMDAVSVLYRQLFDLGICDYTLLFDACKQMQRHQKETQIILVTDILMKSVNGTYPAYGPLFWYIPEYELYEQALLAAAHEKHAKALALVRDVCFLFGQIYTAAELTDQIDLEALYHSVRSAYSGVRGALCELFYLGSTDYRSDKALYPRCFHVQEAIALKDQHCGLFARMTEPFEDELGLFKQTMYPELNGEYIGIVSCPYDKAAMEQKLSLKHCGKVRAVFLTPTDNRSLSYVSFLRRSVRALYLPENISTIENDAFLHMGLQHGLYVNPRGVFYYDRTYKICRDVSLPDGLDVIPAGFFWKAPLCRVQIPDSVETIGANAFRECEQLSSITIPKQVRNIGEGAFSSCNSLTEVVIPGNVESIGEAVEPVPSPPPLRYHRASHRGAFEHCQNLRKVCMEEGVRIIGENAFLRCSALVSVAVPKSVALISEHAFQKCESLSEFCIPENVTELKWDVFCDCVSLRSVTLHSEIRSIGQGAFKNCERITEIALGPHVERIGVDAFKGCSALTAIHVPARVNSIGRNAFSKCTALAAVTLAEGLERIGDSALSGCTSLETLAIPDSVQAFGNTVFQDCTSLKNVRLPRHMKTVPLGMFKGCHALSCVDLPQTVQNIEPYAFSSCQSLVEIVLPDGVSAIPKEAFSHCARLERVEMPAGLLGIWDKAFASCFSLKRLTIPDSVSYVAEDAFLLCFLQELSIPSHIDLKSIKLSSKVRVDVRETHLRKEYVLPEELSVVPDGAFANNDYLESVVIPGTVQKVGQEAFGGCGRLKEVFVSDGVEELGGAAFADCPSLHKVRLPSGLHRITGSLFAGCVSLEEIHLPQSLRGIGRRGFCECRSLKRISLPERMEEIGGFAFAKCSSLPSFSIPHGVTRVSEHAFEQCVALQSISIADSVEILDAGAFLGCTGLECVEIPESVIRLGRKDSEHPQRHWDGTYAGVFGKCTGLSRVILGSKTEMIGDHTFEGCHNLRQIVIPDGVRYLGCQAFQDCVGLQAMSVPDSMTEILFGTFENCKALADLSLPKQLQYIGAYAFHNCEALVDLKIPDGVAHIQSNAFRGCSSLTRIKLPAALETIGAGAFENCSRITEVHLPATVKQVEDHAFQGCTGLKAITISYHFQDAVERIFGQIDPSIITFV